MNFLWKAFDKSEYTIKRIQELRRSRYCFGFMRQQICKNDGRDNAANAWQASKKVKSQKHRARMNLRLNGEKTSRITMQIKQWVKWTPIQISFQSLSIGQSRTRQNWKRLFSAFSLKAGFDFMRFGCLLSRFNWQWRSHYSGFFWTQIFPINSNISSI